MQQWLINFIFDVFHLVKCVVVLCLETIVTLRAKQRRCLIFSMTISSHSRTLFIQTALLPRTWKSKRFDFFSTNGRVGNWNVFCVDAKVSLGKIFVYCRSYGVMMLEKSLYLAKWQVWTLKCPYSLSCPLETVCSSMLSKNKMHFWVLYLFICCKTKKK